jgi:hypothetical protein
MEIAMEPAKKARYDYAKKTAREIRSFYINLTCYCVVMPVLIIINLMYYSGMYWFVFSMTGWGAGLILHGITAFKYFPFLSADWEQKKIKEFIEQEKQKRKTE